MFTTLSLGMRERALKNWVRKYDIHVTSIPICGTRSDITILK
jgi:hypothetical protein